MKISEVIVSDKDILGGTPVFAGTRVPIKNLFDYLEAGDSIEEFSSDFDYIPREHAVTILEFSEKLLTEQKVYESFAG